MLPLRCSDQLGSPKDVSNSGKHRLVVFYLLLPNEDICFDFCILCQAHTQAPAP